MKKLCIIGLLMLCGCEQNENAGPGEQVYYDGATGITVVRHKGHDYLISSRGGIIHSESCTNSNHVRLATTPRD